MNYYFISDIPYHLKINGNYLGKVGKNLSIVEGVYNSSLFEFLPIDESYNPLYCSLESPSNVKIFPLFEGEIIIPLFKKKLDTTFKILGQKQFFVRNTPSILSVVIDGTSKFYVDGGLTLIEKLPFPPENFEVFEVNNFTFFSFLKNKTLLVGYDFFNNTPNLIFKDVVDNFEVNDTLIVQKNYNLLNPTIITEEWQLSSPLKLISRKTTLNKNIYELPKHLLPLSFMETLSVKGDIKEFLAPQLKDRAQELYDFVGSPIYLFPSPKNLLDVVAITNDKLSIYSLEFTNNLISNIIEN